MLVVEVPPVSGSHEARTPADWSQGVSHTGQGVYECAENNGEPKTRGRKKKDGG